MLKKSILASSALAAILFATPVSAQTTPPADDQSKPANDQSAPPQAESDIVFGDYRRPEDIIVSTGVPQYSGNVGQAVTLIKRDTIERRQTVVLSDLLATTPGVTVSRNGGLGGFAAVRIRGAEGEQTLTLIDGVRVNDPSSPGGGFDFTNLLAGAIDQVEVLRGANSVPWGSQAIGGVINVTTAKNPDYGNSVTTRGNLEYGGFDSVFANAGVSAKRGSVSGSFNAGYLKTDGISAAANGTERDGYRQFGATGRLEVRFTDTLSLDLRGYYADSKVDLDGFPAPAFTLADTPEYARTQELYGYAGIKLNLFDWKFKNRIAFTIADINRDNFDPTFGTTPSFFGRGRSERYEYQGDFQVSDAVRLVGGVEHETTRYFDGSLKTSRGVTSVYGEAVLTPVADLTVTGGVRYDDDSAYGGHTIWSANALYTLPSGTSLNASYSNGFKAPTLYQLNAAFFGNPNLVPERARGYDIGLGQKIGNNVTATVTWFHRDTRNQIDFDLGTSSYGNIARTRAQGIEFALNARPTDRLIIDASYSFIDSTNRSPGANLGKDLARRPHQSGSVSVDWETPFKLSIGATVLAVGHSFDDAGNFNRLDSYAVVGVRASMPIGDKFSIYGRVDNLFDEKYTVVRGYGTPGRAAYGGIRLRLN